MDKSIILQRMGLTAPETTIYLALLDLGPSKITKISEKTGVHRPVIYKTLPSLIEKKLVTKGQRQKSTVYVAEPPNRLEAILDDLRIDFFEALPDLEDQYSINEQKPRIRFLEDKEGSKRVFDDLVRSLKRGETFYRISSNKSGLEKKDKQLPRSYQARRDAKQLQREVITNQQTAGYKKPKLERSVKIMPDDFGPFEYDVTEIIYANKVAFIDSNSDTATIIESRKIAEFQKHVFKMLFKRL